VLCVTHDMSAFAAAVGMPPIEPPRADGMNVAQAFYVPADGSQPKRPLPPHHGSPGGTLRLPRCASPRPAIPGSVMFPSGERMIRIQCDVIGAFFDQYIKNREGSLSESLSRDLSSDLVVHRP